jgi:hypothetical protein
MNTTWLTGVALNTPHREPAGAGSWSADRSKSRPVSLAGSVLLLSLLSGLLLTALPASAQISLGVSLPGLQIGINVPVYPRLVRVPGYPVYYDPQAENNYFFYEGLYWVFRDDTWYESSWYNGPWRARQPDSVPLFVLRVPVRYYRQPPGFFRGWRADAAPRWGEHFGRNWQQANNNWDRWDRRNVPAPAPLPTYQRHYSGEQYPQAPDRQQVVREQHYRYPVNPGRDERGERGERGGGRVDDRRDDRRDDRGGGRGEGRGEGRGDNKGERPGKDKH